MTCCWYGTLIVTLPCINGIVICADKSLTALNGMVLTNRVKIHQLGRKAAFSMTGLARADALDPTLAPVWDPVKTVENFFAEKNLNYIDRHKDDRTDGFKWINASPAV